MDVVTGWVRTEEEGQVAVGRMGQVKVETWRLLASVTWIEKATRLSSTCVCHFSRSRPQRNNGIRTRCNLFEIAFVIRDTIWNNLLTTVRTAESHAG